jgi:hypothetical protein
MLTAIPKRLRRQMSWVLWCLEIWVDALFKVEEPSRLLGTLAHAGTSTRGCSTFAATKLFQAASGNNSSGISLLPAGPHAGVVVDVRRTNQSRAFWGGRQGTTWRCPSQFEVDPQRGSLTQPNVGRALSESTLGTSAEDGQVGRPTASAFSPLPSMPPRQADATSCTA